MVKAIVGREKNTAGDVRFNVYVFSGKEKFIEIKHLNLNDFQEVEINLRQQFNAVVIYKNGA